MDLKLENEGAQFLGEWFGEGKVDIALQVTLRSNVSPSNYFLAIIWILALASVNPLGVGNLGQPNNKFHREPKAFLMIDGAVARVTTTKFVKIPKGGESDFRMTIKVVRDLRDGTEPIPAALKATKV